MTKRQRAEKYEKALREIGESGNIIASDALRSS
jgi:hypothetical protein